MQKNRTGDVGVNVMSSEVMTKRQQADGWWFILNPVLFSFMSQFANQIAFKETSMVCLK